MQIESANLLSEISQITAREDLQGEGDVSCQPNVSDRRNVLSLTVLYCTVLFRTVLYIMSAKCKR